ncbi:MAG: 6-hydroxymethylpterin diphosphokinase MptE-like protein, partial [Deltaproteobacteria bacterium]
FVSSLYNRNIFNHEERIFRGKPAIMVAAGPSLEDEFENLRRIKEEGSAYIFTVGSAIKALVSQGIEPHAAITMDPGEWDQYLFSEIIEKKISTIPLIYGTSVGFETVKTYPGPQIFMTMDKDTVTPFFLRNEDNTPIGMVNDAPTIAITSIQLLSLLGFEPIVLVGQNLGFRNNQNYAKGIAYDDPTQKRDHMATARELANIQTTVDVYGKEMQTNKMYNLFRKTMEFIISKFPGTSFINTTRGGARINGAPFKELDLLMADQLTVRVVDEQWVEKVKQGEYDVKYLLARKERMRNSLKHLKRSLDEMGKILGDLKKHIAFRNTRQLAEDFMRLDKTFKAIIKNDFYRTFLTPLNMMETAIFGNGMALVHAEILQAERAEHVVNNFGLYVAQCNRDLNNITDVLFPYIEANIDQFQKWKADHDSVAVISPPDILPLEPENDMTEQMAAS